MRKTGNLEYALQKRLAPLVLQYNQEPDCQRLWDVDYLLPYVVSKDISLKRKPESIIRKALEGAVAILKEAKDQESSSECDENVELMEVKDTNFMNKSIINVYQPKTTDLDEPNEENKAKKRSRSEREEEKAKRKAEKKSKSITKSWTPSSVKLSDLGGIDNCIEEILQIVALPLKHPELYAHLGIQPPRGILLHGPPGCGKTMLANAIATETQVPFINISAPSIVSGMSGESEKKIREVFDEAKQLAPCILFIDEIDAITPKRETAQREMERRIVAQLLTCMDDLSLEKTNNKPVLLIGATNRPDSLDPALRRAGRFDREIGMTVPDEEARMNILRKMCQKLRLSGDFDFRSLAKLTPGYVGADLNALTAEAGVHAVQRIFTNMTVKSSEMDVDMEYNGTILSGSAISQFLHSTSESLSEKELEHLYISQEDFMAALKKVQPSSKREGFATVPDVSWEDIGALSGIRDELRMAVVEPVKHPEFFQRVGINAPVGVLLYGPPGCGKTLLAKAVANESHCNFISVKGPELLNKYVGESERAIRQVFARAQASAPCIIFFDELDALCPARSNDSDSQSSSRLVNTLLTEMDGMQGRKNVYVIAATNRPDMIDPAMLRPGRLDKALYVDLPTLEERLDILKTVSRKSPLHDSLDLAHVAGDPRCDGFSGADLASLVREAAVAALRASFKNLTDMAVEKVYILPEHFNIAFGKVIPSVSKKDRRRYELLKVKFGSHNVTNITEE